MTAATMTYQEAFAHLDSGRQLTVRCPDGQSRRIWGYNPNTGDMFVSGWTGDAFMDCSNGTLRVTFPGN